MERATPKAETEREAEETRRQNVAAELAALLLLRRAVSRSLETSRPEPSLDLIPAILHTRLAARQRSLSRLRAELELDLPLMGPELAYDLARARMTARGYERALVSYARAADGDIKAAARRADHKLVTAAATDSNEAFNHQREQAARRIVEERGFGVWKVWDSTLDKLTCPVCERAHGSAVPAHEEFPLGRPGGVHPRCRCVERLLTADQIDFG